VKSHTAGEKAAAVRRVNAAVAKAKRRKMILPLTVEICDGEGDVIARATYEPKKPLIWIGSSEAIERVTEAAGINYFSAKASTRNFETAL